MHGSGLWEEVGLPPHIFPCCLILWQHFFSLISWSFLSIWMKNDQHSYSHTEGHPGRPLINIYIQIKAIVTSTISDKCPNQYKATPQQLWRERSMTPYSRAHTWIIPPEEKEKKRKLAWTFDPRDNGTINFVSVGSESCWQTGTRGNNSQEVTLQLTLQARRQPASLMEPAPPVRKTMMSLLLKTGAQVATVQCITSLSVNTQAT